MVTYSYDRDRNRSTLTYPDGTVTSYNYTNRNQVASISSPLGSANYTYCVCGHLVARSLDNGVLTNYALDQDDRVSQIKQTNSGGVFETLNYAFNSVSDVVSKQTINTQFPNGNYDDYTYDPIDQVTNVAYQASNTSGIGSSRTVNYGLDSVGNRTTVNDSVNGNTAYSANNLNQYSSVGGLSCGYDGNGNLVSGSGIYLYDSLNRLISATTSGSTITFSYDALNRCVSRTVGGVTTYLIYDGWNLIAEYIGNSSSLSQAYLHGWQTDELIAKKDSSGTIVHYCSDHLGSTSYLTDRSGNVVEHYTYDIYGAPTVTDGSGNSLSQSAYNNRFFFTGREYLVQVGLYDYRNRVYSASLGRFLQVDPIRVGASFSSHKSSSSGKCACSSSNSQISVANLISIQNGYDLYTYAENNPTDSTDSDGLLAGAPASSAASASNSAVADAAADAGLTDLGGGGPEDPIGDVAAAGVFAAVLLEESAKRHKWYCTATCNVQKIDKCANCPERVSGSGTGTNQKDGSSNFSVGFL